MPNSYLTSFTTDVTTGRLKFMFGYVDNSQHFEALTEAQAIAKVLCGKRSSLDPATYEVLLGMKSGPYGERTMAGAVIWTTED